MNHTTYTRERSTRPTTYGIPSTDFRLHTSSYQTDLSSRDISLACVDHRPTVHPIRGSAHYDPKNCFAGFDYASSPQQINRKQNSSPHASTKDPTTYLIGRST